MSNIADVDWDELSGPERPTVSYAVVLTSEVGQLWAAVVSDLTGG